MENVAFCACSYIRKPSSVRGRLIGKAIESWRGLLELPFGEKIFLDDHSPGFGALRILASSSTLGLYTKVQYQPTPHAPHSNFGIVGCLELATTPYIVHLDDDVSVTDDPEKCRKYIEGIIAVMEKDPTIMGGNLIGLDPAVHGKEWLPGEPYGKNAAWSHPQKLFGTSGCVIRRKLLDRVPLAQILKWGDQQPAYWESLVTQSPREFITGPLKTPFSSPASAFFYSATARNTLRTRISYHLRTRYPRVAELIDPRKRLKKRS